MSFYVLEPLVFLLILVSSLSILIVDDLIKKETNRENSEKLKLYKTLKKTGRISLSIFGLIEAIMIIIELSMNL